MKARTPAAPDDAKAEQWCKTVGSILIRGRHEQGLSQSAAAAKLGMAQTTVAKMERNPDRVHMRRLLAALRLYGLEVQVKRAPRAPRRKAANDPVRPAA